MMNLTLTTVLLIGAGVAATAGITRPVAAQPTRPVVVELFTSEGCSSCPPADALLTELARDHGNVLPLAFHITYWDQLGWRDPYSLTTGTDRQRYYARLLGSDTIYTPQMVVDGTHDVVGSDRSGVLLALREATRGQGAAVSLRAVVGGDKVTIDVGAAPGGAPTSGEILLIGYDSEHRTSVHRGENAGRMLTESNVVRSITIAGGWTGAQVTLTLPTPQGERVAVLLQARDGRILGAATGG